jgi:hypothetical protein
MPESPRWLAKKDRWADAERVITMIHAKGGSNHRWIRAELAEIREVVDFERRNADVTYESTVPETVVALLTRTSSDKLYGAVQTRHDQPYAYRYFHSDLESAHWNERDDVLCMKAFPSEYRQSSHLSIIPHFQTKMFRDFCFVRFSVLITGRSHTFSVWLD